ncbi:hypothetical protein [Dictyobacter arantiisoli]|uniref:Uncharacterized protein n=1 Tax=Dictyobacter arantiisoli TaxID=2014874 RepID=A0A5A5TGB0_9CHLR|nr:hypothetical protein [Dictyobacter arantiisoli]GCF10382.1 hypothetical protein KDI_39460 [Dictyobacter arantiisoli]
MSTAETIDAVELAEIYTPRWPLQENIIRDFLLPLGLDTNHGYSKRPVENSEVAKKRATLEKRLAPFFHLPGLVTQGQGAVEVSLRPFNDKRYNQDLETLCERVNAATLT